MDKPPPGPKAGDEPKPLASAGASGADAEPGEPDLDPKPLAAYRLGLHSFDLWLWHKVFWEMPGDEATWHGVTLAVEHLRDDRLILADEIHQNVFGELPRVLDDLDNMAEVLVTAWRETGTYGEQGFGSRIVPGRRHWEELRILADRAFGFDHPLRSIYDLGAAVGEYQLRLWENGVGSDRPPEKDTVPEEDTVPAIRPLVRKAMLLPDALVQRIPQLRSLVELSLLLDDDGQEKYLREYLGRHPETYSRYIKNWAIDMSVARQLIDGLDSSIQEGLLRPFWEPPKPVWNPIHRKLCFLDKTARILKKSGTDIEVVLNAFQEEGWPKTLLNPFLDDKHLTPSKVHELVDSLNCGLTMIKFHADGTGRGISWKRIPTP